MNNFDNNRILVIDDNQAIHADFRKVLCPLGGSTDSLDELERKMLGNTVEQQSRDRFELTHAHQGQEGFELFRKALEENRPFAAVFVDMRMPPGWDGLRTIQEIRKLDSQATIVICTAYSDHSWDTIAGSVKALDKLLILKKPFDPVEVQSMARSLRERWVLLQKSKLRTEDLENLVADRTRELEAERAKDRMRMEELERIVAQRTADLRRQAMNDRLTGLPNRVQFYDHLLAAIAEHMRDPSRNYAVMFLDFDRFKVINDSLGHEVGDRLLQAIAERLALVVGSKDIIARESSPMALAARLGGDEFCILMRGFENESRVMEQARKILDALSRPYDLGWRRVNSTVSIGITLSRFGYRTAEDVLRDADTAMYAAKAKGRGNIMMFDQSMHEHAMRRLVLENDLVHAIDRGELSVWYQPIVSLFTRQPEAAEALLRWNHPQHGMISPADFIPLAEETGLIVPIGHWVFEQVCHQLRQFPQLRYISFNVSLKQFIPSDFFAAFREIIGRTGVDTGRLVAEITETALTCDCETARVSIDTMRNGGIRVFLDDFGAGISTLAALRRFKVDGIKLDRSFLDERVFTRTSVAVIHSVVTMARDLDISLVMEGVESLEQVAMLQALNCELAQGYLFSRPVPVSDLAATLETGAERAMAA